MSQIILMALFFIAGCVFSVYAFIHAPAWAQLAMCASISFAMVGIVAEMLD